VQKSEAGTPHGEPRWNSTGDRFGVLGSSQLLLAADLRVDRFTANAQKRRRYRNTCPARS
jgi:hypothetical protein